MSTREIVNPGQCVADQHTRFIGAVRSQDGSWRLRFKVSGAVVYLPDGRKLVTKPKRYSIRAKQIGRKQYERLSHAQK